MTTKTVLIRSSRDPVPLPDWLRVVCCERALGHNRNVPSRSGQRSRVPSLDAAVTKRELVSAEMCLTNWQRTDEIPLDCSKHVSLELT